MKPAILFIAFIIFTCLTTAQERFSVIDGQKFRINELGEGPVTVIFECGMSDSIEIWGDIPDSVALFTHVFFYDRADIGKSDTSRQKRTIPNMVSELRKILEKEQIKPPYVLVDHSMGGFIARHFSANYPDEVKGLLLLDPATEKYWDSMSKKELEEYLKGGNEWYRTKFRKSYWGEWFELIPNLQYMRNLKLPVDLPTILISASAWEWFDFHKYILRGLKNSKHVELDGEHHIFKNHSKYTIDCIKKLVEN